ncbi:MAG: hypothetical protein IH830_04010 [Planctomycetes bacterium]|nr:hypothetical protein [Planctomycetota bacterium]
MGTFGQDNPPIVALFGGSTVLQDGQQYFVTASINDGSAAWNWNNQLDFSPHVQRVDLGDWTLIEDFLSGAFRVNGTLVPVPGVLALLGVAGLAARRRRRTV